MSFRINNAALERSNGPRFLAAIVAGLGALVAAALFLEVFDGGLPKPARAEAAVSVVLAAGGGPARPSVCFHGPAGELLGFAPSGQRCR